MNPITAENKPRSHHEGIDSQDRRSARWDLRNAPKTYFSLIVTQAAGSMFAFSAVWLVTKALGSEGYGAIVAVLAASQLAQVLVNWTSYAVVRFGTEEYVKTEKIARIFWLRLLFLLPNLALVLLTSTWWFPPVAGWLELPAETFPLVALHFIGSAVWTHIQLALQSVKKQRLQGGLRALERLLLFISLVVLFALGRLSPLSAMFVYGTLPLLVGIVGFACLSRYVFAPVSFQAGILKEFLKYSIPLLPFALVGYFSSSYIDAVFVTVFLSTRELGVYAVASQINGLALQIPTLANSILFPLFVTLQTENKSSTTSAYFKQIVPSLVLVWGVVCAVGAFVSHYAIPAAFGEEFVAALAPLWVLFAASTIALPVLVGYSVVSHSTSTTYISMFAAIFSAVVNIGANFLLIPRYGMVGCAWATALAFSVGLFTFAFLLRRAVRIPISWTFVAILPSVGAAWAFTLTGDPVWSLATCVGIATLVAYTHMDSLTLAFSLLRNYGKAK